MLNGSVLHDRMNEGQPTCFILSCSTGQARPLQEDIMGMSKGYLLDIIVIEEGFDSEWELLETYAFDSVVPGVCSECENVYHYEPDQDAGWCEICGTNTVVSCLILGGIM